MSVDKVCLPDKGSCRRDASSRGVQAGDGTLSLEGERARLRPQHLYARRSKVAKAPFGRSPGLSGFYLVQNTWTADPKSQWRDRAGFTPASLFSPLIKRSTPMLVSNGSMKRSVPHLWRCGHYHTHAANVKDRGQTTLMVDEPDLSRLDRRGLNSNKRTFAKRFGWLAILRHDDTDDAGDQEGRPLRPGSYSSLVRVARK
jgi:hypothetical protein